MELAVHLSLISIVNGWPLSLEKSQQLSQYFRGDIRKAILHLQLMLSWQPTDPMMLLTLKNDEQVVTTPSSCSLSQDSLMYYPWRNTWGQVLKPSYWDLMSVIIDERSDVDCIQHSSIDAQPVHKPWVVTLEPSLLDEFPSNTSSCSVGWDILNTLCHLLYTNSDSAVATKNSCRYASCFNIIINYTNMFFI